VCITKVKGTEINSLKKWGEKYPNKNIPWELIWKSLTHQTHPSKKMVITFVGGAMVTLGGCTVAQMKAGVIPHNFASNFFV
jgi:hypothetical protein